MGYHMRMSPNLVSRFTTPRIELKVWSGFNMHEPTRVLNNSCVQYFKVTFPCIFTKKSLSLNQKVFAYLVTLDSRSAPFNFYIFHECSLDHFTLINKNFNLLYRNQFPIIQYNWNFYLLYSVAFSSSI